ncbi:MAG: hypothetical protein ACXW3P_10670 [Rhodospirillales bacterium]
MRKALFAVLTVMVVLVALAELGVNIAPLLAGAGIQMRSSALQAAARMTASAPSWPSSRAQASGSRARRANHSVTPGAPPTSSTMPSSIACPEAAVFSAAAMSRSLRLRCFSASAPRRASIRPRIVARSSARLASSEMVAASASSSVAAGSSAG